MDDVSYLNWRLQEPTLQEVLEKKWPLEVDTSKMDMKYWKKTWEGAKSFPEVILVDKNPYQDVYGWTVCDKENRSCQIIIDKTADYHRTKLHELMHALGWDHPDYPVHFPNANSPIKDTVK